MQAMLLGLMLLCACSGGSDLFDPSAPSAPNVYPHGIAPGGAGPQMPQHVSSRASLAAVGRAPR